MASEPTPPHATPPQENRAWIKKPLLGDDGDITNNPLIRDPGYFWGTGYH